MKVVGLLFLIVFSCFSYASDIDQTKIKTILAGEVYGDVVFLEIEPKPSTVPGCQTNPNYSYAFNPTTEVGKVTLSLVLTAYASGKNVFLNGYDLCGTNSAGVEDLRQIWVK